MTRLEIQTRFYWEHAQLASRNPWFPLAVRGFDGLLSVAGAATTPRLRVAAAWHVGVAARGRGFPNALGLEQQAIAAACGEAA
ncbi:hypothetical protein [Nitrospirillum bahiense]|uniref:Uncharacterized protein n=1 Tax=Nitrospirillum amazonense TaxID=28077 RepID=A0A560F1X2_9PROT|nr:hypothetical protein [Nitrospirillum amazonense]TWB15622.1 hypothetical protein FBZ88_12975 [Nitrospirillum amazonense]